MVGHLLCDMNNNCCWHFRTRLIQKHVLYSLCCDTYQPKFIAEPTSSNKQAKEVAHMDLQKTGDDWWSTCYRIVCNTLELYIPAENLEFRGDEQVMHPSDTETLGAPDHLKCCMCCCRSYYCSVRFPNHGDGEKRRPLFIASLATWVLKHSKVGIHCHKFIKMSVIL